MALNLNTVEYTSLVSGLSNQVDRRCKGYSEFRNPVSSGDRQALHIFTSKAAWGVSLWLKIKASSQRQPGTLLWF